MVKRYCVLFPDGSLNVHSNQNGDNAAAVEASRERDFYNKGERDPTKRAAYGLIDIDIVSFKEMT